jgi:succinate dehydrogenase / fumarate reductase, membrane anchor subunit
LEDLVKSTYRKESVGAHYGLRDWLLQRITAVVMVAYTLGLGLIFIIMPPTSYAMWKSLFAGNFVKVLTFMFIGAVLYHAWVGVKDIWMDYVKPTGTRLTLQVATALVLLGYAVWGVVILWS